MSRNIDGWLLSAVHCDLDEPVRRSVWKRPQEDGIHDTEHRGVCADSERKNRNHTPREQWPLAQGANPMAKIMNDISDIRHSARIPALFLLLFDPVHSFQRNVPGFLRCL